jgi:hypothetical protein
MVVVRQDGTLLQMDLDQQGIGAMHLRPHADFFNYRMETLVITFAKHVSSLQEMNSPERIEWPQNLGSRISWPNRHRSRKVATGGPARADEC